MTLHLSRQARIAAGVLLLILLTVELGGRAVEAEVAVRASTDFQLAFARAGHAHAGVLVILGLVGLIFADAARLSGLVGVLGRYGIPAGAALMSAGFFLSSVGQGRTTPNDLIVLLWLGALVLAAGLITLAVGLLRSAVPRDRQAAQPPVASRPSAPQLY